MKTKEKISVPIFQDLRAEAIRLLLKELGVAKTAFFIRNNFSSPIDYLELKDRLFADQTVEQIYEDIQTWKTSKSAKPPRSR